MDYSPPSFDWNQARAFLVTAETGSFSAAARTLHLTQPTVGRQVAALEQTLDLVLFERIGRKLVLTPSGRDLLDHLRAMGEAANLAALVATGRAQTVAGDVVVSVTDIMAYYIMPHVVAGLHKIAPDIRIKVIASNDLSDLQRRDADIAVRHVAPTQDELITRKLRTAKGRFYAARSYLERHGTPQTLQDAAQARFICIGEPEEVVSYFQQWGLPVTDANMRFVTNSGPAGWEMARMGQGITAMTDDLACQFPEMQMIWPDLLTIDVPYWLTTHRELQSSKRIRLVYDHLAKTLGARDLPHPARASPAP